MRPHSAFCTPKLILLALPALFGGCSTTLTQEPIATASIAPRPPEGMMRNAPPAYIETGSLGNARAPHHASAPRDRWSETPRPVGPMRPAPAETREPQRWRTAPGPYAAEPGRAPMGAGARQVVVVREGDTLYGLSRRYRVPLADIIAANRITGGRIEVGQQIVIPAYRPAMAERRN